MKVFYKCSCNPDEQTIDVPDRRKGADIIYYMEVVMNNIGYDHFVMSPHCHAEKSEYIKIPADNPNGIGMPKIIN